MPDLLKAGLIRSLATAPIARPRPSRESRVEDGFASRLDTARNSVRESREAASSERSRARASDGESTPQSDSADKKTDDHHELSERVDAASPNPVTAAAPIVVVTIAGPVAPTAESPVSDSVADAAGGGESTQPSTGAISTKVASQSNSQSESATPAPQTSSSDGAQATENDPVRPIPGAQPGEAGRLVDQDQTGEVAATAITSNRPSEEALKTTAPGADSLSPGKSETPSPRTNRVSELQADTVRPGAEAFQAANQLESSKSTEARAEGESIRDVRVGDALDRALKGDSHRPSGNGDEGHREPQDPTAFADSRVVKNNHSKHMPADFKSAAAALPTRPTGVTETTGDVSAAAIGRFLAGLPAPRGAAVETRASADAGLNARAESQSNGTTSIASTVTPSSSARSTAITASREPAGSTFSQILATRLDPSSSLDGAARALSAGGASGRHQVTLRLAPAELGELRLDVRMHQGVMNLRIDADTAAAGRLIESRLGELREALAGHGIAVERAEVVVRSDASANTGFEQRPHADDAPPRHQSSQRDAGESGWNFGGGESFSEGDRSGRSDANPWWASGDATGVSDLPASAESGGDAQSNPTVADERFIDLVA